MTEESVKPSQETYKREALYMEARQRQSEDFDRLLSSVPEEKEDVIETIRGMANTEPDKLLSPEKLRKLKEDNETLFREVSAYYMNFLKEALGID